MNSDIRLNSGFWQHPKTVKLIRRLGLEGVRSLQMLWCWTAVNRCSGVLTGMDADDVEVAAAWCGDAGLFIDTCVALRWLDMRDDGIYVVHDWREHNGYAANDDIRSDKARFKRLCRENPDVAKMLKENGTIAVSAEQYQTLKYAAPTTVPTTVRTVVGTQADSSTYRSTAAVRTPDPVPDPVPDPKKSIDCAELFGRGGGELRGDRQGGSTPEAVTAEPEQAVMTIALTPRDGVYPVTEKDIDGWSTAYPGLDVLAVLRRINSWMDANPHRRKTRRGIRRCIDNWLAREQDSGKGLSASTPKKTIGGITFQ